MMLELQKAQLLAWRLGALKDAGELDPRQISVGKLNNVREAIAICREARTILGANGITTEYPVMRHANNLESVLTYEGTSEIHTLILGEALTGERALHVSAGPALSRGGAGRAGGEARTAPSRPARPAAPGSSRRFPPASPTAAAARRP